MLTFISAQLKLRKARIGYLFSSMFSTVRESRGKIRDRGKSGDFTFQSKENSEGQESQGI